MYSSSIINNYYVIEFDNTQTNNSGIINNLTSLSDITISCNLFTNDGTILNEGSFNVSSNIELNGLFTNQNEGLLFIDNSGAFTSNDVIINTTSSSIINRGSLTANIIYNNNSAEIKNNDNNSNDVFLTASIIYNYNSGVIENNGSATVDDLENADGSSSCGTGVLTGTNQLTATGNNCPS